MKKIIISIAVLMLIFIGSGCDKETLMTEEPTVNFKSAEMKSIPITADFYAVTSTWIPDGLAYSGNLGGNFSHLGKIDFEKSTFERTGLEILGPYTVRWEMFGEVVAADGDALHYTLWGIMDQEKNEYTSTVTYSGGTGRFENASGYLDVTGYVDESHVLWMKGDGLLSNVGSSK